MVAFRFIFPNDDEGFELVDSETTAEIEDDEDEETSQSAEDDVIWETEED
ncbi:hypothetical protein QUA43_30005 [Microcoleus sp. N9_B4]